MRRIILCVLGLILAALVAARLMLSPPGVSVTAMAMLSDGEGYNILDLDLPVTTQTAGSALIAEMNSYYLTRQPTEKNPYTGLLAGKNLILILAESWQAAVDKDAAPSLYRLWSEGANISQVYAPDWYQDGDGREFALLSGLVPTTVAGETALAWVGGQKVYLPFALARCLGLEGYTCLAAVPETGQEAGYAALGFSAVEVGGTSDLDRVSRTLPEDGPFFLYSVWTEQTGERALTWLLSALAGRDLAEDTVICVYTGDAQPLRGGLYLWGAPELAGALVTAPCSELDVTPTLLNLFGVRYDSRFLSGRDIFSGAQASLVSDAMPLVSLYGSAYSDWVTQAGSYTAAEDSFQPAGAGFSSGAEQERYVRLVRKLVYDRYVFARRVMENNYFQIVLAP